MNNEIEQLPPRTWTRSAVRALMTVMGAVGGAVLGLALVLAIVVFKARLGHYTFSIEDLVAIRWETVPVLLCAPGGAILGFLYPRTLDLAALRGFMVLVPCVIAGALIGPLLWGAPEGAWAGGIIFGTAGLLAGAISALPHCNSRVHPLRSGVAGAVALLGLGALGAVGVTRAEDLTPLQMQGLEAVRLPRPEKVDAVVFLVGDAGAATRDRTPLLHALGQDVERWSGALARDSATSIIFLGDNVYPAGVHDRSDPSFQQDSARLWSQIALVGGEHATANSTIGLFVTGNHDWGNMAGEAGLDRVINMAGQLTEARRAGYRVALLPAPARPGPVVRDLRENVRILFIDTHWFLQERSTAERAAFFERLREAMLGAGDRAVIIVAHHPFYSAGPHGVTVPGYHDGGIEYLLKRSGTLVQDLNSPVYEEFLAGLRATFREVGRAPLLLAGGHDHSLQVLDAEGEYDPLFGVVSGAGSKVSAIRDSENLAWGAARPGYMFLVFRKDDAVDLFVVAGDRNRIQCTGQGNALSECMAAGVRAFDIEYSATLLGPSEQPIDIPRAPEESGTGGTPWWPQAADSTKADSSGRRRSGQAGQRTRTIGARPASASNVSSSVDSLMKSMPSP